MILHISENACSSILLVRLQLQTYHFEETSAYYKCRRCWYISLPLQCLNDLQKNSQTVEIAVNLNKEEIKGLKCTYNNLINIPFIYFVTECMTMHQLQETKAATK